MRVKHHLWKRSTPLEFDNSMSDSAAPRRISDADRDPELANWV